MTEDGDDGLELGDPGGAAEASLIGGDPPEGSCVLPYQRVLGALAPGEILFGTRESDRDQGQGD